MTSTASPQPAVPPLPKPYETPSALNFSTVVGWPEGKKPSAPDGFEVTAYATGLDYPRWFHVLPNGDVLVSEARTQLKPTHNPNSPAVQGDMRSRALGQSANRITLLRDADGDGVPEIRETFLAGLNQPFGMALLGDTLYVANTDGVFTFPYAEGQTRIEAQGRKILDLPAGGYNNHWTRNIRVGPDGTKLYVTVGSASNVAEYGIEEEERRAAILEINPDGSGERLFASGLRNPVGMDWEPETGAMWTAVNERDELGDELVPDYITSVRDGGFYGWPYAYFGTDRRPAPCRPAAGSGREIDRSRSGGGLAHRVARPDVLSRNQVPRTLPRRSLHRPARLLEPRRPFRLQGAVRPLRRRPAERPGRGLPERLRRRAVEKRGLRPPLRRHRTAGRLDPGGGRRRQHGLAGRVHRLTGQACRTLSVPGSTAKSSCRLTRSIRRSSGSLSSSRNGPKSACSVRAISTTPAGSTITCHSHLLVLPAGGDRVDAAGAMGRHAGERHHSRRVPHHQPVGWMPGQCRLAHLRRKVQGGDDPRPERRITQATVDQDRRRAQIPHDGPAMGQKGPPEWRWIGNAYRNTLRHPSQLVTHLSKVE